jgi:hypothetical protein
VHYGLVNSFTVAHPMRGSVGIYGTIGYGTEGQNMADIGRDACSLNDPVKDK